MNVTLKKSKKGIQLNQAFPAVLVLVSLAVLVIMAIFIFVSLGDSSPTTTTSASQTILTQSTSTLTPAGDGITSSNANANNQTWLDFDGVDDNVNLNDKSIYSFVNETGMSFSLWVKPKIDSVTQSVISKGKAGNWEYDLRFIDDGTIAFLILQSDGGIHCNTGAVATPSYSPDNWYLIYGEFINGTGCYLSVNGLNKIESTSLTNLKGVDGTANLKLGRRDDGANIFNGSLDDFKFQNNSLNNIQIRRLYNESYLGSGLGQSIPILLYHNIENPSNVDSRVNLTDFQDQMNFLNTTGYSTITMNDWFSWRNGNKVIPEKSVVIFFDDGWKSVFTNATPIMDTFGYVGVVAIITDLAENNNNYMNWTNLKNLSNKGWQMASHSINATSMKNFSTKAFSESKQSIIGNLSITPTYWVYPNNENNNTTDDECAIFYTMCSGSSAGVTQAENFLFKNANLTHENGLPIPIRRIIIDNETDLSEFKNGIDYFDGRFIKQQFNENSGTIAHDLSGNGNDGTITSATWNTDGLFALLTEGVDYSISATTGLFTILNTELQWSEIQASWIYISSSGKGATDDLIEEFSAYTSLIGLVGTIIFLSLIIAIIVGSFIFSSRKV